MTATILCYGDSNTHGTMPLTEWGMRARYAPGERWPDRLARALPDVTVIAEGHPGRTTVHDDPIEGAHRNGLSTLLAILESHAPIDLVILMLGTNDVKTRFSVTPDDIGRSIDRLIGIIAGSGTGPDGKAPGLLVVSPVPIRETNILSGIFAGGETKSRGLAPVLARVAAARGTAFLDAGTVAEVSEIDGVHLSSEAHARLGDAVAGVVRDLLP